ncbi:MAG: AraC family transcriptional regulator [Pseudomonadota bacterium]
MNRLSKPLDHADRLERVLSHIRAHLDDALDLERLAEVACLSPHHFHRLYRAVLGETAAQTVRRLRLHRAAVALARSDAPIPRLARQAGYGSLEAFSRAFSKAYGLPPAAYRRRGVAGHTRPPFIQESHMTDPTQAVTVGHRPALRLAGYVHVGPYEEIGEGFERLFAQAGARGAAPGSARCFAIYYDDPEAKPPAELRSFAGMEVDAGFEPWDGLDIVDIPAGETAAYLHVGPYADLPQAYQSLYGRWLPQSGREPADRPAYEEYLNDCTALPPSEWQTRINLPLA